MDKRIYRSPQWRSDLDEIVDSLPILDALAGKSVLITGATGLICSAVIDVLLRYNQRRSDPVRIYAAGRSREKAEARFGDFLRQKELSFVAYDAARTDNDLERLHFDYIIHGASNATPTKMMAEPVETMLSNFIGMKYLLDCAKDHHSKRILYISSSEVYGQKESSYPFRENEYGYVDLLNPRNSYSMGKRAAETLCAGYSLEYGVDYVIARPGHIYGPTASVSDSRVSSVWAHASAKGEAIVMKSEGEQLRSYCYCPDCASAILTVLLKGQNGCAYNVSNPDSIISIREMALLLANAGNVQLSQQVPSQKERQAFNPMRNSSLDSSLLCALSWRGIFDAERGLGNTVKILKQLYGSECC